MGGSTTISTSATRINAMQVQRSAAGATIAWLAGRNRVTPNLIYYNDFEAVAHTTSKKSGGKGGGGVNQKSTTYTYYAAIIVALGRGVLGDIHRVFRDKDVFSNGDTSALAQIGLEYANGAPDQPVWGYLLTHHPDQALAYADTAYVYAARYQLNENAGVHNHTFEVDGPYRVAGKPDANPGAFLPALLTDPLDGVGFDPAWIADLSSYSDYCLAENLLLSPVLEEQQPASEVVSRWLKLTNSDVVWSAGLLKVLPYGDQVAVGNGVTWYPNLNVVAHLTDDDFLAESGTPPVSFKRRRAADCYNEVSLEFLDRAHEYNTDVARALDQAAIEEYGRRPLEFGRAYDICEADIANHACQLMLQRKLYVRNEYEFALGWQHVLLEPMDLVSITTSGLGLNQHVVRIISVEEDDDGELMVTAEDALLGVGNAPRYPVQGKDGYVGNQQVPPGPALPPVLFNPPESLLLPGELQIWAGVAGAGEYWGGCEVWVSADGDSYRLAGTQYGASRFGALTAPLPVGADPDTANTLSVQLSSPVELRSGTTGEADAGATLVWCSGELLSCRDALLTGAGAYDLTYLRRGRQGTTVAGHPVGAPFVRLDDAIWKYAYAADQVGDTVWVKLCSFNVYGQATERLEDVTAYSVLLQPAELPPLPAADLQLVGPFDGPHFTVSWLAGARALDRWVRIRHGVSNALLREVTTSATAFTYTRDDAQIDGSLVRSYRVDIVERNTAGSAAVTSLLVSNPAPAAVSGLTAVPASTSLAVSCDAGGEADIAGYVFVYGTSPGFDPATAAVGYQGAASAGGIDGLTAATTYYLRAAAFDSWSAARAHLNFSAEISVTTT